MCDALLGTTGSARILYELEQEQLFTSSDDNGVTFHYHEVMRAHLEWALVQEHGAAVARCWYAKSAALLEAAGDRRPAARAYARAEDWGSVARLIQACSSGSGDSAGADVLLPTVIVQQDPWLSLAQARRWVRDGALSAAADAFRQAEVLLDEPGFRDTCHRERALAVMWSKEPAAGAGWVGDPRPEHWSVGLREALLRGPAQHTARDDVGRAGEQHPGILLSCGLASLLDGDMRGARGILEFVRSNDRADTTHRVLAQLTATAIDLMTGDCPDASASLGQIALDADLAGLPWVSRLARGVQESVLVALGSPAWRMTACVDLIRECEQSGDDWGAAILKLSTAAAAHIAHADAAADGLFADAASHFHRLNAPVLAVWAQALQACLQASAGIPGAAEFANRAAAAARALQVPPAESLATAAASWAGGRNAIAPPPATPPILMFSQDSAGY